MPWNPSYNAGGALNELATLGGGVMTYAVTPTTVPKIGMLVEAKTYQPAFSGDGKGTPPYGRKAAAAGNFKGVGVCIGGPAPGTPPVAGGLMQVQVEGPCLVLFKTATAANDLVIVSTATAGYGKESATVVAGKTWGVILHTTANATSHTILIYCYIHKL